MIKTKMKLVSRQAYYVLVALVLVFAYFPNTVSASAITTRSVTLSTSVSAATNVTYTFTFKLPSTNVLQSATFTPCTTASGSCTMPNLFSGTGSSISQPTGLGDAAGWSADSTGSVLRLKKTGNAAAPNATSTTVVFNGVTNPTIANGTFYIRIATFSGDDYITNPRDTGTVATSTAGQITVNANVDETLTFTLATASITLSPNPLTSSTTGTGTSTMTAATNAQTGYTISYSGNTLTSGSNTLTAMAGGASILGNVSGNSQFGINLKANATPSVGSDPTTGSGAIGAPISGYGTADSFKFLATGDNIASASGPSNANTFTTSYIANIASTTPAGAYTTTLTYVATANF